jgi:AcrR family transcriptional regulator
MNGGREKRGNDGALSRNWPCAIGRLVCRRCVAPWRFDHDNIGAQIAERAEIAPATFFLYFRGKADVVLSEHGARVPALIQAIIARPAHESDLTAVRWALLQTWAAHTDPQRTARTARAVASSAVLQGMSYKIGGTWLEAISEAFARRRELDEPSEQCVLSAHAVLGVLANAVEGWIANGCREDLKTAIERNFASMAELSSDWAAPKRRRKSG